MTKEGQYYSATIGADTVFRLVRRPRSADPLDGFLVSASSELAMLYVT